VVVKEEIPEVIHDLEMVCQRKDTKLDPKQSIRISSL